MLGTGDGEKEEMRILNKVVRTTKEGIELEADPRHAELVIKELGLESAKSSPVPGSKEDVKKSMAPSTSVKASAGTIARRNVAE